MRVLVGGVGYRNLRDGSIGPYLIDRMAAEASGGAAVDARDGPMSGGRDGVEVEDLSYHPVGLSQNLQDRPRYDRLVFVAAVGRGLAPGTVSAYRWDGVLPSRDQIQERVSEAVTGVISLENTLIVCGALGGLPDDVRVVEVEPADEGWGEGFSPEVEARLGEIEEAVWTSTRP